MTFAIWPRASRYFNHPLCTLAAVSLLFAAPFAPAQTAGEGTIQGTVTDTSGAVIANATVTAINNASGVSSARSSTSAGFFSIAPLPAGAYTVTVTANGFQKLVQDNLIVDSLQTRTFSPVMKVGRANQTVTVTAAPPLLNTADATMGMTIENYQQQLRRRRLYPHPVPGAQKRRAHQQRDSVQLSFTHSPEDGGIPAGSFQSRSDYHSLSRRRSYLSPTNTNTTTTGAPAFKTGARFVTLSTKFYF